MRGANAADDITKGFFTSCASSAYDQWANWLGFCGEVFLVSLQKCYRDPVPILIAFARQYLTGKMTPSGRTVYARMEEDVVLSVG